MFACVFAPGAPQAALLALASSFAAGGRYSAWDGGLLHRGLGEADRDSIGDCCGGGAAGSEAFKLIWRSRPIPTPPCSRPGTFAASR